MIFKNPAILWLLPLLIIPILVHLFQWRKFKKEYFTNVAFLSQVVQQNRKSQTIKKWLLLSTRLLALGFLILAFAQPYFPASTSENSDQPLVFVLDQSWGMQAKIQESTLLQKAGQDLLKNLPDNQAFWLVTADNIYENTDKNSVRNELLNLPFHAAPFSLEGVALRLQQKKLPESSDIVILTHASTNDDYTASWKQKFPNSKLYALRPESRFNASIDSVFVQNTVENRIELGIDISWKGDDTREVSLAVYDGAKPITKQSLSLEKGKNTHQISLPSAPNQGYIRLEEGSLDVDNDWFFSMQKAPKTNVLVIYDKEIPNFLPRIATADEFEYQSSPISSLDYPSIDKMDAVVVYELEQLPSTLAVALRNFVQNGGRLVFVPHAQTGSDNLNSWFSSFAMNPFVKGSQQEQKIQRIVFNHPLYKGVFSGTVQNFQYPQTKQFYKITAGFSKILAYDDDSAFAGQRTLGNGNVFVFANPFTNPNGNFTQSPLVVPTLYRMMKRDESNEQISHFVHQNEKVVLNKTLPKEAHVKAVSNEGEFIPMMMHRGNGVEIQFDEFPNLPGHYHIVYQKDTLQTLGFNIPRKAIDFSTEMGQTWEGFERISRFDRYFSEYQAERTEANWWKIFVLLVALMLFAELLIQKFIK